MNSQSTQPVPWTLLLPGLGVHGRAIPSTLATVVTAGGAIPPRMRRRAVHEHQERSFKCHPAAVRAVRDFVAGTLTLWRLVDRVDDAKLCVSELATNAIEHGAPIGHTFLVRLASRQDLLRVEVHDGGDRQPEIREARDTDDDGRGLFLVASIADDWGVDRCDGSGKVVWCEFKLDTSGTPRTAGAA